MMMMMMNTYYTTKKGQQHLSNSRKCMPVFASAAAVVLLLALTASSGSFALPNSGRFSLASASASASAGAAGRAGAATAGASTNGSGGQAIALANTIAAAPQPRSPAYNPLESARKIIEQKRDEQLALIKQQEIRSTLESLNELEGQETKSLEKCAKWFNLNQRLKQLTNQQAATRAGEVQKKIECDKLYQLISDMRAKLDVFEELAKAENNHLEFVGGLVNSYQELKNLASENPLLAKELAELEQREPKVALGTERVGQFLQFMEAVLGNPSRDNESPAAVAATVAAAAASYEDEQDDFKELDRTLRELIDREGHLNEDELGQLAELTGLLDRLLSEGHIDYNSGRFRYLMGTLEAGRGIVMHAMASNNTQPEREFEQQYRHEPEPQPEPEPEPLPLPLPVPVPVPAPLYRPSTPFAPLRQHGGASAVAIAHSGDDRSSFPQPEPIHNQAQAQAQVEPRRVEQDLPSLTDQIGQRVSEKLGRFKFAKRGSFASGFASTGNGAATAGAQAASSQQGNSNNSMANSLVQSSQQGGFAASQAAAATTSGPNNSFAGSQAATSAGSRGGFASSASALTGGSSGSSAASAMASNH